MNSSASSVMETAQATAPNLFSAGLELMLAGMGTVFTFLTLLVLATITMSALVQRFGSVVSDMGQLPGEGAPTAEELAAITAAIHQHRQR